MSVNDCIIVSLLSLFVLSDFFLIFRLHILSERDKIINDKLDTILKTKAISNINNKLDSILQLIDDSKE